MQLNIDLENKIKLAPLKRNIKLSKEEKEYLKEMGIKNYILIWLNHILMNFCSLKNMN